MDVDADAGTLDVDVDAIAEPETFCPAGLVCEAGLAVDGLLSPKASEKLSQSGNRFWLSLNDMPLMKLPVLQITIRSRLKINVQFAI